MMTLLRLLAVITLLLPAVRTSPFAPETCSFSVRVRDNVSAYRVWTVTVLPEKRLTIEIAGGGAGSEFALLASDGRVVNERAKVWNWTAPAQPGLYTLELVRGPAAEKMLLNAFVLVPREQVRNGKLNGYRIGDYPATALKGLDIYKPPRGFIEVTADNVDTRLSPHFTLRQFLCKQDGGYPKYVVLRERLLLKLELLLARANEQGIRCDTFHVMSGYRTPDYNRAIGNVKYSRHVYGGAADVFVDVKPEDGMMDDLNGDGTIDVLDAGVLYDLFDRQYGRKDYEPYVGGLGRYKATPAHGPFVHVDVRGFRARWGD